MAEIEDQKNAVQKSAGLNTTDAAAALAAKRELEAARKKLSELQVAAQTAPGPDKPKAYQAADEAQKKVKEAEAKLNALAPQPMAAASAAPMAGATAAPKPAAVPTFVAEHTLAADETLSHLALKYYGHATLLAVDLRSQSGADR